MTDHLSTRSADLSFIVLADLHLSDLRGTATHAALEWAVGEVNRLQPGFLALAGDITTFGTTASTALLLEALHNVRVPLVMTPGNAELRDPAGLDLLRDHLRPERRHLSVGEVTVLLPDTSTGALPPDERRWLDHVAGTARRRRLVVITHYPLDALHQDSAAWLERWLAAHHVELLVGAHRHWQRMRLLRGGTMEMVCRGLDPDKAIGDLPGLCLCASSHPSVWRETFLPWSPAAELLPCDVADIRSPVGCSIAGDPAAAAREVRLHGLSCLELRPKDRDFSRAALTSELGHLRETGPVYLSYHLPDLQWDAGTGRISGAEEVQAHLDLGLAMDVDSFTMHVPRPPAHQMERAADEQPVPTALYLSFVELYADLFNESVRNGVHLAIENLHNDRNTPNNSDQLRFATRIGQYLRWIDAVSHALPEAPAGAIGALLDVGHARNNGGELDNRQPLGDWYLRLGRRILGYHIHQVDRHPDTGQLANHLEITSLFGKRIAWTGLLWAWSRRMVARAPLFVEVRDAAARRNTVMLLKHLFDQAADIRRATDLPGRLGG